MYGLCLRFCTFYMASRHISQFLKVREPMYKKVYIIDDDEVSVFIIRTMLEAEHFAREYEIFLSSTDALKQLLPLLQPGQPADLPEVIFLDLNMPQENGWGFLDALVPHAQQLKHHCRLYILTSSVDTLDRRRAGKYTFLMGFLHKPLEEADIKRILSRA